MTIFIQLFKIHPEVHDKVNAYSIEKLEITAFDSLGIDLNTPISPMPLPEENADANILVKMEGNSKQVRLAFKFDSNLVSMKVKHGILEDDIRNVNNHVDVDKTNAGTINYGNDIVATNNLALLSAFLDNFESRSITDSFFFRLVDSTAPTVSLFEGVGSIASISTSADSSSPVVWNVNLDFLIGDVVSVYDADTPEIPEAVEIDRGAEGSGEIVFKWKVPSRSGGTPLTEFILHLQSTDSARRQSFTVAHTTSATPEWASGSYDKDDLVYVGNPKVYYSSDVDSNTNNPTSSGTTNWTRRDDGGSFDLYDSSTQVYTKAVDDTLSIDQYLLIEDGKTYRCFITAGNTGGSGTRSESSLVTVW